MKQIFLTTTLLLLAYVELQAQQLVGGIVSSNDNKPVAGVTVVIQGTTIGTTTDIKGSYSIKTQSADDILQFSFIGYETVNEKVGSRSRINVILKPSDVIIDDVVVVVGYGSLRRKDMTGSVASIKSESLENRVLFSVDDALSGAVAGLMVSSASGKPGSESNMLIRGVNSLTGSTAPLVVLDGFPMFGSASSVGGGIDEHDTGMSSLSMINPDDIASIEVLKDASATAIYGNRGSNGVIIITSKKGRADGGKIQYNTYFGLQTMDRRYDMMDFNQFATYQQERAGSNSLFTDLVTGLPREFGNVQSVDWQDKIYRTGFIQNHSLSASHSTEKTNMLFSGSYMDDESVLIATDWQKLTAKATIDHRFTDRVRTGIDISYNRIMYDGVPTGGEGTDQVAGIITSALTALPFDFDETTQAYFRRAGVSQGTLDAYTSGVVNNPVATANSTQMNKRINRTMVNAYVEADLLKDLTLRVQGGYDSYSLKDRQFYPTTTPRGNFYKGQAIIGSSETGSWINENTITWSPTFGKHRLNVLGGVNTQGYTGYMDRNEATQFEYEELGYNNTQMAKVFNIYTGKEQVRYLSLIGRANYTYDNRYIATFTIRRDATSRFVKNKWGTFFSGALAWNIDSEEFMKNQYTISTLKLRLSAGEVGNSNVPTSGTYSQLGVVRYPFGSNEYIGQSPVSVANENLSWETTREYNVGLELGLLKDKIRLTADVYNKITRDLLLEAPVMNISGFDIAWQNIGKMRNRGVEISLNAQIIDKKEFKWSAFANFARNKTKVLELGQNGVPIYLTVNCLTGYNAVILQEGGEIGDFYGYVTDGIYLPSDFESDGYTPKAGVAIEDGSERAGSMRFADIYQDGKIDANDRKVIGNSTPDFFGAFGTSFSWKNLDLNVMFQYSYGGDIYNANYNMLASYTGNGGINQMASYAKSWSYERPDSRIYSTMTHRQVCSAFVEDASFLRLRSARLSYTLPRKLFGSRSHIDLIKVYVAGENLFCSTKYSGYDPEVYSKQGAGIMTSILTSGFDYGCFPRPKTFTIGLNILFK